MYIHDKQSDQISQKQDEHNTYVIMKTMCPPGHHQSGFVATQAFGHMIYVMHTELLHGIEKPVRKVLLYIIYNTYMCMCVFTCKYLDVSWAHISKRSIEKKRTIQYLIF